jgi:hypothetical protein
MGAVKPDKGQAPTDPNIASHQDWLDAWAKLTA